MSLKNPTLSANYFLVECALKNASYSATFDFKAASQNVSATSGILKGVPASSMWDGGPMVNNLA